MLPLIPLALTLAPELAKWLFGAKAAPTAAAVASVVQTITGTADPEAAKAVLGRDQSASDTLRVELAKIAAAAEEAQRSADLDAIKARLADVADARQQTQGLARLGSSVAWGAPVVSVVVLATFGIVMWAAMTRSLPEGSDTMVNLLLGSLAAMASSVVAYWVGSSAGSAAKNTLLFNSQPIVPPGLGQAGIASAGPGSSASAGG